MLKTPLIFLLLLLPGFCSWGQAHSEPYRILMIVSYHSSFPTYFDQIEGVRKGLSEVDYYLDVESMDSKRFFTPENLSLFEERIRYKLANLPSYDGIITADDNALDFVLSHQDSLFSGIPVVFFGVNDRDKALRQNQNPHVTGVIEAISMGDTLDFILKAHPRVERITAIVDNTVSAQGDLSSFYQESSQREGPVFSDLNVSHFTLEELEERFPEEGSQVVYLLLSAYNFAQGVSLDFEASLAALIEFSPAPIYHLWYHGMGAGITGGKLISHYHQGLFAAERMGNILGGLPVEQIPVEEESPNRFFFDYRQLARFGVPLSRIPPESEIIHQPVSFLGKYRNLFLGTLGVILIQGILILLLVHNVRRRKRTEGRFRGLFEHSPLSLWVLDLSRIKMVLDSKRPLKEEQFLDFIVCDTNSSSLQLLGKSTKEELKEDFRGLFQGANYELWKHTILTLYHRGVQGSHRFPIPLSAGKTIWINLKMTPAPGEEKSWRRIFLSIDDISSIVESAEELAKASEEKAVLLKEINHRVKNNLSIVSSLLELQKGSIQDGQSLSDLIKGAEGMVRSIAMVHELVMDNDSLAALDIDNFFNNLSRYLIQLYHHSEVEVTINNQVDPDLDLSLDQMVPLGLIVNEVYSGLLRYNTKESGNYHLDLKLLHQGEDLLLMIQSDNLKTPSNFHHDTTSILGYPLISLLTSQLEGDLALAEKEGFQMKIRF